jgi:hypothetical protein
MALLKKPHRLKPAGLGKLGDRAERSGHAGPSHADGVVMAAMVMQARAHGAAV